MMSTLPIRLVARHIGRNLEYDPEYHYQIFLLQKKCTLSEDPPSVYRERFGWSIISIYGIFSWLMVSIFSLHSYLGLLIILFALTRIRLHLKNFYEQGIFEYEFIDDNNYNLRINHIRYHGDANSIFFFMPAKYNWFMIASKSSLSDNNTHADLHLDLKNELGRFNYGIMGKNSAMKSMKPFLDKICQLGYTYTPFYEEKTLSNKMDSTIAFSYYTESTLTEDITDMIEKSNIDIISKDGSAKIITMELLKLVPISIIAGFISFLLISLVDSFQEMLQIFAWGNYDLFRIGLYIILIPYFALRIRFNYFQKTKYNPIERLA